MCTMDPRLRPLPSRGGVLGSQASQRATKLRGAHRDKVARNEVRASPLWARPCRAYNVQIELGPRAKASLEKTQRVLKRAEPGLLVCPPETLHVSVAWLLAVHVDYPAPKDPLWGHHGAGWTAELRRIAAEKAPFWISYGHVVATEAARQAGRIHRGAQGRRWVSHELRFERSFDAAPEEVFDALTDPEGLEEMYGRDEPGWIVESEGEVRGARRSGPHGRSCIVLRTRTRSSTGHGASPSPRSRHPRTDRYSRRTSRSRSKSGTASPC